MIMAAPYLLINPSIIGHCILNFVILLSPIIISGYALLRLASSLLLIRCLHFFGKHFFVITGVETPVKIRQKM